MRIEYDCFDKNKVSVWCGKFESKAAFGRYIEIAYSNRGDVQSCFLNDYCISDFDEDYIEKLFVAPNEYFSKEILRLSYIENFSDELQIIMQQVEIAEYNSFLFVFDCNASYMRYFDDSNLKFLGVCSYRE